MPVVVRAQADVDHVDPTAETAKNSVLDDAVPLLVPYVVRSVSCFSHVVIPPLICIELLRIRENIR